MKNIILLENSARVNLGGGQKVSLYVADILLKDNKIVFADFTNQSRYWEIIEEKYKYSKKICLKGANFTYKSKLLNWFLEFFLLLFYAPLNIKKLYAQIEKYNTLVYVTTKKGLLYAYILYLLYKVPYIYHCHLVENKNTFSFFIFRHLTNKAKKIICVSKSVFETIDHPHKIIIYNPILNTKGIKKTKNNNKFIVAAVGSLIEIKGFEYFIKAAIQVNPNIEFRIYGEGRLKNELSQLAHNRVKFMGFSNKIIEELYKSIDIIVMPTIIKEALPLTILEAKSVGIPSIVTNIGGQAEIVRNEVDGFHVPIKDSNSIKNKIELLISDLSLYNKMSMEAFKSSYMFNYSIFSKKIEDCFNL